MINSLQNKKIKDLIKLKKSSYRKKEGVFLIDGYKELSFAIKSGFEILTVYYSEDLIKNDNFPVIDKNKFLSVSKEVFEKISFKENPDGFIAVAREKITPLLKLKLSQNPLVIILESIEKPGNIGAIMRTADALALDAVILISSISDVFNPNAIRSSLGTIFTNQISVASSEEVFKWLKSKNIASYAATPEAQNFYYDMNFKKSAAIFIGSEHNGLKKDTINNSDYKILIPMHGKIDSLNASVSAAVILYEANRQRVF